MDYSQHPHHHHQQQQQQQTNNGGNNTFGNSINLDGFTSGWGQSRHEPTRPASLPMGPGAAGSATNPAADLSGLMLGRGGGGGHTGQSAESSSESEASFIKGQVAGKDAKDKKAGSGVFRIFSKKKSKNHN